MSLSTEPVSLTYLILGVLERQHVDDVTSIEGKFVRVLSGVRVGPLHL